GEGRTYIGSNTGVSTDGSGNAAFNVTVPALIGGQVITATATDANGNTSEFSAWITVIAPAPNLSVNKTGPSPSLIVGQNSTYTITVTNGGTAAAVSATVKDAITSDLDLVSATGSGWSCTPSSGSGAITT